MEENKVIDKIGRLWHIWNAKNKEDEFGLKTSEELLSRGVSFFSIIKQILFEYYKVVPDTVQIVGNNWNEIVGNSWK